MQQQHEQAKRQIDTDKKKSNLKFGGSHADALEEKFKEETIGLVSAEAFREKRQRLNEMIEAIERHPLPAPRPALPAKSCKLAKAKLSFMHLAEEEGEDVDNGGEEVSEKNEEGDGNMSTTRRNNRDQNETNIENYTSTTTTMPLTKFRKVGKSRHLGKDPTVDTKFLPDSCRDEREKAERERLIEEYYENEAKAKDEILEVTYSYWDGSGHRRTSRITKGSSIGNFLDKCRRDLEAEFHELKGLSSDGLIYIKEDLILPANVTFYDLIKTKARGKSGPLFHFDVHDDVRLLNDVRVEKDESHAGKIVDRKWYERNKHIFPASRWEPYDSSKTYEKYTIHGSKDWSVPKS